MNSSVPHSQSTKSEIKEVKKEIVNKGTELRKLNSELAKYKRLSKSIFIQYERSKDNGSPNTNNNHTSNHNTNNHITTNHNTNHRTSNHSNRTSNQHHNHSHSNHHNHSHSHTISKNHLKKLKNQQNHNHQNNNQKTASLYSVFSNLINYNEEIFYSQPLGQIIVYDNDKMKHYLTCNYSKPKLIPICEENLSLPSTFIYKIAHDKYFDQYFSK